MCYLGKVVLGLVFFGTTLAGLTLLALANFLWQLICLYFQALWALPWYVGIASVSLVSLFTSLYCRLLQHYYHHECDEQLLNVCNEMY